MDVELDVVGSKSPSYSRRIKVLHQIEFDDRRAGVEASDSEAVASP